VVVLAEVSPVDEGEAAATGSESVTEALGGNAVVPSVVVVVGINETGVEDENNVRMESRIDDESDAEVEPGAIGIV